MPSAVIPHEWESPAEMAVNRPSGVSGGSMGAPGSALWRSGVIAPAGNGLIGLQPAREVVARGDGGELAFGRVGLVEVAFAPAFATVLSGAMAQEWCLPVAMAVNWPSGASVWPQ